MRKTSPDQEAEMDHLRAVVQSMQEYSLRAAFELERRRRAVALLPSRHAALLPKTLT